MPSVALSLPCSWLRPAFRVLLSAPSETPLRWLTSPLIKRLCSIKHLHSSLNTMAHLLYQSFGLPWLYMQMLAATLVEKKPVTTTTRSIEREDRTIAISLKRIDGRLKLVRIK